MLRTKFEKFVAIVLLILVAFACGWRSGINRTKETLEIVEVTKKSVAIAYEDDSVHMYEYN